MCRGLGTPYLSHLHRRLLTTPMKMEQTGCFETSAHKIQTTGNHPNERIKQLQIVLILYFRASGYKSNETPILCNTVQVLFLQSHSTCFGGKRTSSGVLKTGTAATGTCVIVVGKSSHHLIRAENGCVLGRFSVE